MYDFWVSGIVFWIFWLYGLVFWVLNLYFECLDLYFGFWTYIWVSGLVTLVSELILRVFGSGRDGRVGRVGRVGRIGRVGRAAGSGEFNIWGKTHFGNLYPEKSRYWLYYWILNLGYFYKKDARRKMLHFGVLHAPRSLIWDPFRPEN